MKTIKIGAVIETKIVNNVAYKLVLCEENGAKTKIWIPEYSHLSTENSTTLNKPILDDEKKITHLYERLKKASDSELIVLRNKVVRLDLHELPSSKREEIRAAISALLETHKTKRKICPASVRKLRQRILYEEMVQKRRYQLSVLFCLEKEINLASSKSSKKIRVENVVDLEVLPFDFSYVNENVAGDGVVFPKNPPIGCDCRGERICILNNCCPEMFNRCATYNECGLVMVTPHTAIYECNRNCKCLKVCANRIVQRGSNIQFVIFRTENCKWAVRTSESISKGSFVIEYVGEVITRENAIKRSTCTNSRRHLFDLDFNTENGECRYTVDSTFYGNLSRFLNHSCEPNLSVYSVWINWSDPNIYHVAFFASREILRGEELTFNYTHLSRIQKTE